MATVDLQLRYRIKPPYQAAVLDSNEVLLKGGLWGGIGFVLKGSEPSGVLGEVVAMLNGELTVTEMLARLDPRHEAEALSLLNRLLSSELIEEGPQLPPAAPADGGGGKARLQSLYTFLSCITNQSRAVAAARLGAARILVVGAGAIGARLGLQLAQTGVRSLRLLDHRPIEPADYHRTPYLQRGTGSRAAVLARTVSALIPDADARELEGGAASADAALSESVAQSDFVLVAEDAPDLALYQKVNAAALTHGVKWSIVTLDAVDGLVGPTFIPRQTCCYVCYQLRLESNLKYYDMYVRLRDAHGNGRWNDRAFPIGLTSVADILAGFATYDCIRAIATEFCFTFGRTLRINFQSGMVELNDVLKLPRCPACGHLGRGLPGTQIYNTFEQVIKDLGV